MSDQHAFVLNIVNGVVCAAAFWGCICRLNHMSSDTKNVVRFYYAFQLGALASSAFSAPLFKQNASYPQLLLGGVVLLGFAASFSRWRGGAPADVTRPGALT